MIHVVTLNPAIDKTVLIDNFSINCVNRIYEERVDCGGKGINVSRVLKVLNAPNRGYALIGGATGNYLKTRLATDEYDYSYTQIANATRTNIKIVDPKAHTYTDINAPGPDVSSAEIVQLEEQLFNSLQTNDILVLAGSLPRNANATLYSEWIERANAIGAKVLLDADGQALQSAIASSPFLIKPNHVELAELCERKAVSHTEIIANCRALIKINAITTVVVSMGEQGALFINEHQALLAVPPKVKVASTVGAGDTMVAVIAHALDNGLSFVDTAKLATAASAAAVTLQGTEAPSLAAINNLQTQIQITIL